MLVPPVRGNGRYAEGNFPPKKRQSRGEHKDELFSILRPSRLENLQIEVHR